MKKLVLSFFGAGLFTSILFAGDFSKKNNVSSGFAKSKIVIHKGGPIIEAEVERKAGGVVERVDHFNIDNSDLNLFVHNNGSNVNIPLTTIDSVEVVNDHTVPKENFKVVDSDPHAVYVEIKVTYKGKSEPKNYYVNRSTMLSGYLIGTEKAKETWPLHSVKGFKIKDVIGAYGDSKKSRQCIDPKHFSDANGTEHCHEDEGWWYRVKQWFSKKKKGGRKNCKKGKVAKTMLG